MIPLHLSPFVNHLWQSTLFAAIAGGMTFFFRNHQARIRHGLWLAASLKFLIPFSLLVSIGAYPARLLPREVLRHRVVVIEEAVRTSRPLDFQFGLPSVMPAPPQPAADRDVPVIALGIWLLGFAAVISMWGLRWRKVARTLKSSRLLHEGREVEALRRLKALGEIGAPIELRCSESSYEPGIFGISSPVLLLPAGIVNRISEEQLEAVLSHELCHVRRRDNLTSALHMLVEAVFWFHPLVWWLGARLIDARESACDEEVLKSGREPEVYAESILKVCQFYVESPLVCASGVTGADLKKRIEDIMTRRVAKKLDFTRKLLLASFGAAAVIGPLVFGLLSAPKGRAQEAGPPAKEFEVASIKPGDPSTHQVRIGIMPGGRFQASNITLRMLMQQAYDLKPFQVQSTPGWMDSDAWEIIAKPDGTLPPGPGALRPLLQKLLADRFHLTFHKETKEMPLYALVIGKNGSKLKKTSDGAGRAQIRLGRGQLSGTAMSMDFLATQLSRQLSRMVVDKTGLDGAYDVELSWTSEDGPPRGPGEGPEGGGAAPPESTGPSIFTALQEQLGLKLESQKGPVVVYVVDHAEKPSEN